MGAWPVGRQLLTPLWQWELWEESPGGCDWRRSRCPRGTSEGRESLQCPGKGRRRKRKRKESANLDSGQPAQPAGSSGTHPLLQDSETSAQTCSPPSSNGGRWDSLCCKPNLASGYTPRWSEGQEGARSAKLSPSVHSSIPTPGVPGH